MNDDPDCHQTWLLPLLKLENDDAYRQEFLPKLADAIAYSTIKEKNNTDVESDNLVINDNFIICNEKKYPIKRNQKTGSGKSIKQKSRF
jgi:hypothetical protein